MMKKKELWLNDSISIVFRWKLYSYMVKSNYIYSIELPLGWLFDELRIQNWNKFIEYHYWYYVHWNEFNPGDYDAPTRLLYALENICHWKYSDKIGGLLIKNISDKLFYN